MAESRERAVSESTLREWGLSLLWLNLFLSPLLFSARTTEAFELPKLMFQRAVALVFLAGAVPFGFSQNGRSRLATWFRAVGAEPTARGVLLLLLAGAVSTAASISPRTSILGAQGSFTGLITLLACGVLFFATRALCSTPASARLVLNGAAMGMGVSVAYGLVQFGDLDPLRWEAPVVFSGVARVFSTQGHPNSFAQLLAMSLPLVVYLLVRALQDRRAGEAAALGLVAVAANGLALLTLSRAGVLALGTAWSVLAIGGALALSGRRRWLALAGVLALLVLGGTLAAIPDDSSRGVGALGQRLAGLGDSGSLSEDPRRFLWLAAAAMFRQHPLAGVGLDCFSLAFGRQRTPASWLAEWGETPLKAHSQPLEILATQGLLGAAAAIVLAYGVVRGLLRAWNRRDGDPFLALAAFAGLLALGVHTLFHFPTAAGTNLALALAAILSGLGDPEREPRPEAITIPALPLLAIGALTAGTVFAGVIQPLRADVLCRRGVSSTLSEPAAAAAYAREAVRLDASRELLWSRFAAACQAAGRGERDPSLRKQLFEEGRRAAEEAVRLEPGSAYAQANLGMLLADLERESPPLASRAEVEQTFERARDLDPNNSFVHVAAAAAALAAGDRDRASSWARLCSRLYPRFATPRALLGAVSLAAGRELAAAGHPEPARMALEEAIGLLREALAADWHGDNAALDAALANRRAAMQALAEID